MKNNQALIFALNSICYAIQSLHASGHNLFCFKKKKDEDKKEKRKSGQMKENLVKLFALIFYKFFFYMLETVRILSLQLLL